MWIKNPQDKNKISHFFNILMIIFFSSCNKTEDDETVEVDDIIGWDLSLVKSDLECRQYVIEAAILNAASDEHPIPCDCGFVQCKFIQACNNQVKVWNQNWICELQTINEPGGGWGAYVP